MNNKNIIFVTILFLAMAGFGLYLAYSSLLGESPIEQILKDEEIDLVVDNSNCLSSERMLEKVSTVEPHLSALQDAEAICNSYVTNELMIFTDIPKDKFDAVDKADELSLILHEFNENEVSPIVVVEPVSEWGLVDFEEFSSGFYNDWIQIFFENLQKNGVTSEMMGKWVPFPEANLPYWNRADADPSQFSDVINVYGTILKKTYPETHISILLNSATYSTKDFNWSNGEYTSLVPWVEGIEDGLIDSFGIQGFPWLPMSNDDYDPILNPEEFLNPNLAMQAADSLDVREIWFNTGTFSQKYTLDPSNQVDVDQSIRGEILLNILASSRRLERQGYDVSINLFAEDKSATPEATNWSYWNNIADPTEQDRYTFKSFIKEADSSGIDISLFVWSNE